jgi:hypothetical protein
LDKRNQRLKGDLVKLEQQIKEYQGKINEMQIEIKQLKVKRSEIE